eukprot:g27170.t1
MLSKFLAFFLAVLEAFPVVEVSTENSLDLRQKFRLDPFWLRERCLSHSSVDSITLQPLLNPHELPSETWTNDGPTAARCAQPRSPDFFLIHRCNVLAFTKDMTFQNASLVGNNTVQVGFTDGHTSLFQIEDLLKELMDFRHSPIQPAAYERPKPISWSGDYKLNNYDYEEVLNQEDEKPDGEQSGGATKRDLAYTPRAIGFHTDNPYRDPTPDFQLLHALEHCSCQTAPCESCSVLNYLVDGFYIAEQLKRLVLQQTRFLHAEGIRPLKAVRFSAKSGQYAPPMDLQTTTKFYKAFGHATSQPNAVVMQFKPGEILVFDNRRILHARSQILPTDGERWVQGAYIDRDGLWLAFERLRRRQAQPLE